MLGSHNRPETVTPAPEEQPQPTTEEYDDDQWEWDAAAKDYRRVGKHDKKPLYSAYQMVKNEARPPPTSGADHRIRDSRTTGAPVPRRRSPEPSTVSIPRVIQPPAGGMLQDQLQSNRDFLRLTSLELIPVAKPKRFFVIGRIFRTLWVEPGTADMMPQQQPNPETPLSVGEPVKRPRWFVVVRRRPHHSLCFAITAYGGHKGGKTTRSRPEDYVVLHRSTVKPIRPLDEEGITRLPIAMIIEDEELYISPVARLDCGRIYTVEDNLLVEKIGRVHPDSLGRLDDYYMDCLLWK
ncbi:hypothetical protein C8A00DRAFT_19696 [Chaetomidium leptoderma]|uniref:DUF6590 domain-containing protein n=1 Tax=Chaetomidium leptoderma TaxID=669021 RepID=A0AAN6VCM5_9PEZI|nr:hypothetical protein C8A00DRAFT_19696 [Chaetomidium leptoderma]